MLITNARLKNKEGLWQIYLAEGKIVTIARQIENIETDILDVNGKLIMPPFIEPHIHLDSILTAGEPAWNQSGTLFEGIQRWSERKQTLSKEDVKARAKTALKWHMAQGIQHVRTHVDVTDESFTALKALLEVKEEIAPHMNLQLVAFPQEGILSYPNGQELLEEAILMGADVVGGIPHYEFTREMGVKSVKISFQLAEKYDRLLDFHCDEIDDEQSRFIETVAAEAFLSGMANRVTASHTTAMHSYNHAYTAKLFRTLKLASLNIVANPLVNTHLQGRFDSYPKRRGVTRVKELLEEGINVCFGHDDVFDPWYPLGTGNMLQVLHMGVHVCQLMGYSELSESIDLITENSAKTMNIEEEYGLKEGKPANLIVLEAEDSFNALRKQAPVLYSIRNGKIIARTQPAKATIYAEGKTEEVSFDL